jgi:hypothetical protein
MPYRQGFQWFLFARGAKKEQMAATDEIGHSLQTIFFFKKRN